MAKNILFIFGTRPEAIKLAPIIKHMSARPDDFNVKVCSTGQHREMLDQVLNFFEIVPDYELNVMKPGQSLFEVTANILTKLQDVIVDSKADTIVVQGDTTTAFVGALGGFYCQVKVAHVEAGLRTGDMYSPFPEEANRVLISKLAEYHFPPTELSERALLKEGVPTEKISMTGNTVTDAILLAKDKVRAAESEESFKQKFADVDFNKRVILTTAHRRESFGEGMINICQALQEIAKRTDVEIVFPVHLNPNVQQVVREYLSDLPNVHLYEPFDYPDMVWIMDNADIVLTDSGGIQEEAPTLGKPVLVMREVTERPEGVDAGTAALVGTNKEIIVSSVISLLDNTDGVYDRMAKAVNPYGDGHCSERIARVLQA